jgi:uncharacterized protein YjiS (DUF1127 family)
MAAIYKLHRTPAPQAPSIVRSVLAVILAGLRTVSRALKNRRQAGMLAAMDDRMLADIGLNRSDLRDAYAEPLWRDPTDVLAGRARDRRLHRRKAYAVAAQFGAPPIAPDAPLSPGRSQRSPWHYL